MESFVCEGVRLAYRVEGEGRPILLIHGFGSTHEVNWVAPGWKQALVAAGYKVIMADGRGHGQSGKPHEIAAYALGVQARDALALLDHLGEQVVDVMGYSMGAMISLVAVATEPARFGKVVAAGVGANLLETGRDSSSVVKALLAEDPDTVWEPEAQLFRRFADQNRQDRVALAACFEAVRADFPAALLAGIERPVLVVAGDMDRSAGDPAPLAALIPGASYALVPKRDHMKTVGDRVYKEEVLRFLGD